MKKVERFYNSVDDIWKRNSTKDYHVGYYERNDDTIIQAQKKVIKKVANSLEVKENDILLDVGCGSGNAAYEIGNIINCNVIGINISEKQLADCIEYQKKSHRKIVFYRMDACMMKFPASFFDGIYAIESIMHMERKCVINNVYNSLKPKKKFVFTDWYINKILSAAEKNLIAELIQSNYIGIEEYRKILSESRFSEVQIEDWSAQVLPTYDEWKPDEALFCLNAKLATKIQNLVEIAQEKLGYCEVIARK